MNQKALGIYQVADRWEGIIPRGEWEIPLKSHFACGYSLKHGSTSDDLELTLVGLTTPKTNDFDTMT